MRITATSFEALSTASRMSPPGREGTGSGSLPDCDRSCRAPLVNRDGNHAAGGRVGSRKGSARRASACRRLATDPSMRKSPTSSVAVLTTISPCVLRDGMYSSPPSGFRIKSSGVPPSARFVEQHALLQVNDRNLVGVTRRNERLRIVRKNDDSLRLRNHADNSQRRQ